MLELYEYPDRVTLQPDGSYRWKCVVSKEYERKSYRLTMIICGWIAVFVLALGVVFSLMFQDPGELAIVAACVAVFLLISLLICKGLDMLPGQISEIYHLTDTYIQTGSGKTKAIFSFKRTKDVIIFSNFIALRGKFGGPDVFVPDGDMDLVKDFITKRVPAEAFVRMGVSAE